MNLNLSSIFSGWPVVATSSNPLNKDFQDALMDGSITSADVAKLIEKDPSLVNQALPNGELPLHTVVRETGQGREVQLEKINVLLRQGADIGLKDAQGLTAIDHAALLKDKELLIKILGLSIGKDLQDLQGQMELPDNMDNIEEIHLDQQKLRHINLQDIPPIAKAALKGDLSTFSAQQMIAFPSNNNKESVLHYAIKGKQTELVKQMIAEIKRLGLEINQLDTCCNSLLHYGVAVNSPEIVMCLIEAGVPVDQRNTRGETALHFAAVAGHTHLMQTLVKGGASIKTLDNGGRSPLMLYAQNTKANDPLSINELQLTLAAATAVYWLAQTAQASGWMIPYQNIVMPTLFLAVSAFELSHLLSILNANWKKFLALAGYLTLNLLPPFNFCYHLCRINYLVKDIFASCHAAWRNIRYRKWDAVCKLAVSGVNTASATDSLYRSYQANKYWYNLFYECHKIYNSEQFAQIWSLLIKLKEGDPTAFEAFPELNERIEVIKIKLEYGDNSVFQDILNVIEFLFGHSFNYRSGVHAASPSMCPKVDPSVATLPDILRVSSASLNPECPEHAATILSTTFNQSRFCEEVSKATNERQLKYLNGLYRTLSLALHPDKLTAVEKEKCGSICFQKASQAKEILAAEMHHKIYCKK